MLSFFASSLSFLAQAQAAASPAATPSSPVSSLLQTPIVPILAFMVIFYFLLIRPQQKRARAQQQLISSLKSGDRVLTTSGIYGYISNLDDRTVTVKIAEGVKVEMDRSAIATILKTAAAEQSSPATPAR